MNAKNEELFFGDNGDEITVVTLPTADGGELDLQLIASIVIDDWDKEYVIAVPIVGQKPTDQLIALQYSEDEQGEAHFDGVEDPEELRMVGEAYAGYMQQNR